MNGMRGIFIAVNNYDVDIHTHINTYRHLQDADASADVFICV